MPRLKELNTTYKHPGQLTPRPTERKRFEPTQQLEQKKTHKHYSKRPPPRTHPPRVNPGKDPKKADKRMLKRSMKRKKEKERRPQWGKKCAIAPIFLQMGPNCEKP